MMNNNSLDIIDRYMNEVDNAPRMTFEEEQELSVKLLQSEVDYISVLLSNKKTHDQLIDRLILLEEEDSRHDLKSEIELYKYEGDVKRLYNSIRVTDMGRQWMTECARSIESLNGTKKWKQKVTAAYKKCSSLKNEFFRLNIKLVIWMSKPYCLKSPGMRSDIIQEGNIGLIKAIDKFDHTRGFRFGTYAMWWIRHDIQKIIETKSSGIRVPLRISQAVKKIWREQEKEGREMSVKELAMKCDLKESVVEQALESQSLVTRGQRTTSIHEPIGDSITFGDVVSDESFESPYVLTEKSEYKCIANDVLKILDEREYDIISKRFGIGTEEKNLLEIGLELKNKICKERVRQIEFKGLRKMKLYVKENNISLE